MRYPLFNTYIDALTFEETVDEIESIIFNRTPVQHVVLNASKINMMQTDNQLTQIINNCPLVNADGASILWAAKKFGIPLTQRVTGIDLFLRLIALAAEKGLRIFLFGAKEEVVEKVNRIFETQYPTLQIAGVRNGYFTPADNPDIVRQIAGSNADILFVAFSSPQKEYWINEHLDDLHVPFVMGVGGSFDIVAGVTTRAPRWMQKAGFEWFYRFVQEPRRMWKRYVVGNWQYIQLTYRTRRQLRRTVKDKW